MISVFVCHTKEVMKFGEFRKYVSRIDRVSICMKETLSYENFQFIEMVPDTYDAYYLYGVGLAQSEFPLSEVPELLVEMGKNLSPEEKKEKIVYADCMEIMLSKVPKTSF